MIDENEFLTWIKQIQELRPESKSEDDGSKELLEAFRVFDLDNNGYITRDELRTAMEKIGEPVTEMQLTEFINMADTDKDGKINYEGKELIFDSLKSEKHTRLILFYFLNQIRAKKICLSGVLESTLAVVLSLKNNIFFQSL